MKFDSIKTYFDIQTTVIVQLIVQI